MFRAHHRRRRLRHTLTALTVAAVSVAGVTATAAPAQAETWGIGCLASEDPDDCFVVVVDLNPDWDLRIIPDSCLSCPPSGTLDVELADLAVGLDLWLRAEITPDPRVASRLRTESLAHLDAVAMSLPAGLSATGTSRVDGSEVDGTVLRAVGSLADAVADLAVPRLRTEAVGRIDAAVGALARHLG